MRLLISANAGGVDVGSENGLEFDGVKGVH